MLILEIAAGIILAVLLLAISQWLFVAALVGVALWFLWSTVGAAGALWTTLADFGHRVFVLHQWDELWMVLGGILGATVIVGIAVTPLVIRDRRRAGKAIPNPASLWRALVRTKENDSAPK